VSEARHSPLSPTQRARMERAAVALTQAHASWLMAIACEHADVADLKKLYHKHASLFEQLRRVRGLLEGDHVRMFNGPHKGTRGVVTGSRGGAMLLVSWADCSILNRTGLPHAWQLQLIEPGHEETA
jgi:hypothetical protein